MRNTLKCGLAITLFSVVLMLGTGLVLLAESADEKPIRRIAAPAKAADDPEEDKLFVWSQPEDGTQTMLVLKVLDKDTVDAAYLVPVRLKVSYSGKDDLEKLLTGRLLQTKLTGRNKAGQLEGDFWLGKPEGWLSKKK